MCAFPVPPCSSPRCLVTCAGSRCAFAKICSVLCGAVWGSSLRLLLRCVADTAIWPHLHNPTLAMTSSKVAVAALAVIIACAHVVVATSSARVAIEETEKPSAAGSDSAVILEQTGGGIGSFARGELPGAQAGPASTVAWMTDVHFDGLAPEAQRVLATRSWLNTSVSVVLMGGDIATSHSVFEYLQAVAHQAHQPVYFVLGNHDYFGSSIHDVRARAKAVHRASFYPGLRWLPAEPAPVPLWLGKNKQASVGLIGHGGWADGQCLGRQAFLDSSVRLADYSLIDDFANLPPAELADKLEQLGRESARHIQPKLEAACSQFGTVLLLTHAPPFVEATTYRGKRSDDDYLPHFCNHALGVALRDTMRQHQSCHLIVLAGHTHSEVRTSILPNLDVHVGFGGYGRAKVQTISLR